MEDKTITQYCQLTVPPISFSANKAKATPNSVEPFTNLLLILFTSLNVWYREVSAGFKLVGSYIKLSAISEITRRKIMKKINNIQTQEEKK